MKARERMNERIEKHGNDLQKVFHTPIGGVALAKKAHRLEVRAHKLSTDYCTGVITSERWEAETNKILDALDKVVGFRRLNIPVFVNGDARGYALKMDEKYIRENNVDIHRDWGGYGILAPEFDGKP